MILLIIYLIGVVLSIIFMVINYIQLLKENNIKYPHWSYYYYVNDIFWQTLIVVSWSWFGFFLSLTSISNRLSKNKS